MTVSLKTINDNLARTGRLDHRIIGVYGADKVPADAVTVPSVIKGYPCLAKTLFKMSLHDDVPPVYMGRDLVDPSYEFGGPSDRLSICQAALAWFGYRDTPPGIWEATFASDSPVKSSYCVKKSSDLCTEALRDLGKATSPKYLVMQALSDINVDPGQVRSILCFGNAMQIRNLVALVHFSEARAYTPILASWGGTTCSMFVALASGIMGNSPKNTAFLGPTSPESNNWLPNDTSALSIPMEMAMRMAESYERSFVVKRPDWAYPEVIQNL